MLVLFLRREALQIFFTMYLEHALSIYGKEIGNGHIGQLHTAALRMRRQNQNETHKHLQGCLDRNTLQY